MQKPLNAELQAETLGLLLKKLKVGRSYRLDHRSFETHVQQ